MGVLMLQKQISNRYLNESKLIRAKTENELNMKIKNQKRAWKEKEKTLRSKAEAAKRSKNALDAIDQFKSILISSLYSSHVLDWESLQNKNEFEKSLPSLEFYLEEVGVPREDKIMEFIFSSLKNKREQKIIDANKLYEKALDVYTNQRELFYKDKKEHNNRINEFKVNYEKGEVSALKDYFIKVLENSLYPKNFNKNFELGYDEITKNLIIEFDLPNLYEVPNIIEYKYVQSRKEIVEKKMKLSDFQEYYNDVLYQITLRTIYEIFISDYAHHLDTVVFNGWIHGIDTATGNNYNSRIISILANKDEFLKLNLEYVVPKDCFRKLRGIAKGSLHNLSPIKPILELNKDDERFIENRNILAEINSTPNLADMDWEEFEHLVTNLFDKYFQNFGEARVTRRSREGGVDGVIFDSDPIRGGKYLVQAKRYNDIVPPSAVRELAGAISHERATRGILITTSYFGPDSKSFADENNIKLIEGSELVYMLDECGYKVRCEIKKRKKETS
jgi:restriction system protein